MAVETVHRIMLDTGGLRSTRGTDEFSHVYDVECDDPEDTEQIVKQAAYTETQPYQLPRKGISPAEDQYAACDWVYVQRIAPCTFRYTAHFVRVWSSNNGGLPQADYDNPLDVPVVWDVDIIETMEPVDRAYDEDTNERTMPIMNSVQQYIDPPLMESVYDYQMIFIRNEATFDKSKLRQFSGAINDSEWSVEIKGPNEAGDSVVQFTNLAVKHAARCVRIKPTPIPYGGGIYFRIRYEFRERLELDWIRRVLDQGNRRIDLEAEKNGKRAYVNLREWLSSDTDKPTGPELNSDVRLDGIGQPIDDPEAKAVWLEYRTSRKENFDQLGFGST